MQKMNFSCTFWQNKTGLAFRINLLFIPTLNCHGDDNVKGCSIEFKQIHIEVYSIL